MRTSAAGSKGRTRLPHGFTLLELMVVVALMAVAMAGVSLSLRDSADSVLQRDAERLAALLETGRAQARASGLPVVWRAQASGFVFEGLPPPGLPSQWLGDSTRATPGSAVTLGPEPLIEPQAVAVFSRDQAARPLWVVTDGLRPFRVQNTPELSAP